MILVYRGLFRSTTITYSPAGLGKGRRVEKLILRILDYYPFPAHLTLEILLFRDVGIRCSLCAQSYINITISFHADSSDDRLTFATHCLMHFLWSLQLQG